MIRIRRRLHVSTGVNMTAMIDVLLVLILFFMVSSTLVKSRGLAVKLPESKTADSETQNLLVVSIRQDGRLFLNDDPVDEGRLGPQLKEKRLGTGQGTVIIRGDRTIPYARMVEVMDIARTAGMEKISLATVQRN
ncbi:MAG: biopolymer transporter ExbD [Spirochaetes bacterium]|nr:biopolymer transporter ExbD [Spirochaetota bacterium]